MSEKKKVLEDYINLYYYCMEPMTEEDIKSTICKLQTAIKNNYRVYLTTGSNEYNLADVDIKFYREETDEEYNIRLEQEALREKEREKLLRETQFRKYEKLKKIFEGNND